MKYLIVVGDPTTAGGEAVEGDSGWMIQCLDGSSRPAVRVNDAVMCGACGPTKVIQGAGHFLTGGALVAYDGLLLACGHQMIAKSQRLCSVEVNDGSRATHRISNPVAESLVSSKSAPGEQPKYALQFQATDYNTGRPLPHCKYILTRGDGQVQRGQCDESGLTDVISSVQPEQVSIHFVFTSPIGNSISKSDLS
ncbi:PAAR domain-containing protein [Lysobacter auxotrophicus]|uniref:PAAR domain-containing protein n=1 Tax=Lysobacter auxotrophicus TaxID=2992573 RepID=UPI00249206F2|nr:PAAR domain-containing protein [Lysobacter auxotrophicus]